MKPDCFPDCFDEDCMNWAEMWQRVADKDTVPTDEALTKGWALQKAINELYLAATTGRTCEYRPKHEAHHLRRFRVFITPDISEDWAILAPGIVRMVLDWEGAHPAVVAEGLEAPRVFLGLGDRHLLGATWNRIKVRHYYGLREDFVQSGGEHADDGALAQSQKGT